MNKLQQRVLAAYRPLYLHGQMMDGWSHRPKTAPAQASDTAGVRQRTLLAALSHIVFHHRSK